MAPRPWSSLLRWRPPDLGGLGPLAIHTVLTPALGAVVLAATYESWLPPLGRMTAPTATAWFLVATIVLAAASLIPTHGASLVAGITFGVLGGPILAALGIGAAAVLSYATVRAGFGPRTSALIATRPRAAAVHRALLQRHGWQTTGLIALVRLSPLMPFAATNLLLAASGVRFGSFLAGSIIGMLPRIVVVAVAGAGLAELDLSQGQDGGLLVAGICATLAAVLVIGRIARRALLELAPEPLERSDVRTPTS